MQQPEPLAPQALFVLKLLAFAQTIGVKIFYYRDDANPDWATDRPHLHNLTRLGYCEVTHRDNESTAWQITPQGETRLKEEIQCSSQT